jgi:hypothetical protein
MSHCQVSTEIVSGTIIDIENLTIDKIKNRAKRLKGFMKFPIRQVEIKPQTTD